MTFRALLLATATVLAPGLALAQPVPAVPVSPNVVSGLYIAGGIGANWWRDPSSNGFRLHDEDVFLGGYGAIGWGLGNGFRAEIEGNYRTSNMSSTYYRGAQMGTSGDQNSRGVMANVLFDFDLSNFGLALPVTPYIGGGIGYAWQELKGITGTVGGTAVKINNTEANFAYQGIAGLAYNLGGGLALTAEYRYFAVNEMTYGALRTGGNAGAVANTFKVSPENHSAMIGLRYAFNAVPPAPPAVVAPVTAPAVARTYLVFFDWDRADLTERARQIIAEAADASRKTQTTRIEVAGHADRSGTPQYNQRLSQRRADAVAAELVRRGVNRGEIAVTAYGESRPLVPTADGVREPQNRRVEIVLK
ncbi:OmpA family protein [Roseicella aquatilis]|uniref:OmpA family protein n=1 Tax=Roseicella aquatilis TaxID=2527868 RepID=A0A4V6P647_9PROT|nr:OmpA family protein [Roseicella aquatilis]TCZ66122.1 OmpA family protein [Roseicella aquatilis]